jgi:hypothetical protein
VFGVRLCDEEPGPSTQVEGIGAACVVGGRDGRDSLDLERRLSELRVCARGICADDDHDAAYPKVNTYASTPGSRNVISKVRSTIGPGCLTSW